MIAVSSFVMEWFISEYNITFIIKAIININSIHFSDLLQNALIVPLKRLEYHEKCSDYGIFEVLFHTNQPWVFSTGSDFAVRLYT